MLLRAVEAGVINVALKTKVNPDGSVVARQLDLDEQAEGLSVYGKIKTLIVDDRFTDGEVEFTTTEKALILKFCKRNWEVDNLEAVESLRVNLA